MDKKPDTNIRPPIVTIMGHVDHGKTTLLDAIRKTNVVSREQGGITQHIGAYQITHNGGPITFIDTPGHAAFEKMRFRGAQIADIVVLVVAATEGVKPQTQEAIKHIKAENKPIILALTKMDLESANPQKVTNELQKEDVIVESFGGNVPVVEVAAPKGKGLGELLDVIELVWHISPQKSLPADSLAAVVVESFLDKNRGPISTLIVKAGTLSVGQKLTIDGETITVKALLDDQGKNVKDAQPGTPVEVLGFKKVLEVGSIVSEQIASSSKTSAAPASLAQIIEKAQSAKGRFKVVVKADVTGSLEAILANIENKVLVITSGVGDVSAADISSAKVAQAPILAFNLKITPKVMTQAEREGVVIKKYDVIYDLISDVSDVVSGFEAAIHEKKITGRAKIVASFDIEGAKIAGAQVTSGKLKVGDKILLTRDSTNVGEAEISSIRRFKKDLQSVSQGQDCGLALKPSLDFIEGDIIESLGSESN